MLSKATAKKVAGIRRIIVAGGTYFAGLDGGKGPTKAAAVRYLHERGEIEVAERHLAGNVSWRGAAPPTEEGTMDDTIALTTLTELIEDQERTEAPGSESGLWGDFCERMRELTGFLPHDDGIDGLTVPIAEAAWWMGAYAAQEASLHLDRPGEWVPTEPLDGDYSTILHELGVDGSSDLADELSSHIRTGYRWYRDHHAPALDTSLSGDEESFFSRGDGG